MVSIGTRVSGLSPIPVKPGQIPYLATPWFQKLGLQLEMTTFKRKFYARLFIGKILKIKNVKLLQEMELA